MTRTENREQRTENREQRKIVAYDLNVKGWHKMANVVLNPKGISTTIHCQSNNLLQKVIVVSF